MFEFLIFLSNALPGWLGSDERWINRTIFIFFETFPKGKLIFFETLLKEVFKKMNVVESKRTARTFRKYGAELASQ